MTLNVSHKYHSAKADSGDATLVQPSNWNDTHDMQATDGVLLGASGSTTVTEITVGSGLSLAAGVLTATGGGGAIGTDTQIPYNDAGTMAGDADLTWDKSTNTLLVNGTITGLSASDGSYSAGRARSVIAPATADSVGLNASAGVWNIFSGSATDGAAVSAGGFFGFGGGSVDTGDLFDMQFNFTVNQSTLGASSIDHVRIQTTDGYILADESEVVGSIVGIRGGRASNGIVTGDSVELTLTPGQVIAGVATNGNFVMTGLPASDPGVSGALWNSSGTLKVSP